MRNVSDKRCTENKKKNILYSEHFLFENGAVYEKSLKKFVEPGRPQMKIQCICIACWIPKATNTHSGCVIFNALPLQEWLHERASMLGYKYIACLV